MIERKKKHTQAYVIYKKKQPLLQANQDQRSYRAKKVQRTEKEIK